MLDSGDVKPVDIIGFAGFVLHTSRTAVKVFAVWTVELGDTTTARAILNGLLLLAFGAARSRADRSSSRRGHWYGASRRYRRRLIDYRIIIHTAHSTLEIVQNDRFVLLITVATIRFMIIRAMAIIIEFENGLEIVSVLCCRRLFIDHGSIRFDPIRSVRFIRSFIISLSIFFLISLVLFPPLSHHFR